MIKQLLSNFEAEIVADTKQLEAQPKNGVAYKKIRALAGVVSAPSHTKCVSLSKKNMKFNLLLLIYILMNRLKDYVTIYLRLI